MNYQKRDTYGMYRSIQGIGLGPHVYSRDEQDLGDIKEIMLDTDNGEVCYAVLSYGSFLGKGEKLFAVPWEALSLDIENKRFILDADSSLLESAPGFGEDNWPNMADETWANSVQSYYATCSKLTMSNGSKH